MLFLRQTWYLYLRGFRTWLRQPAAWIPTVLISVFMFIAFGFAFTNVTKIPGFPAGEYTTFLAASILVQGVVFSSGDAAFGMLTDLVSGYFDKLLLAPINRFSILLGSLLVAATRLMVSAVVITLVGLALGVTFRGGVPGIVVALLLATLFGVVWSCIGLIIALKTKSAQATQSMFVLFFPALFLTTGFMPRELLPRWFQIAAFVNPVNYVQEAIRAIIVEGWVWHTILVGAAVLLGMIAFFLAITTWLYRRVTA